MLVLSYRIFHRRRRKIMALISSKTRAGIAALILVGGTLASPAASADPITFSGLNRLPVGTYEEGGFTVFAMSPSLFVPATMPPSSNTFL
jgi:hypothetical protein